MIGATLRVELRLALRRFESLVLTIVIPPAVLILFSTLGRPIDFLAPGVVALSIIAAGINLGITTGFERQQGVLMRLGATPLGRTRLILAKLVALLILEIVQVALIALTAFALGWNPRPGLASVTFVFLGTIAFGGLGIALAGRLRSEVNLAVANSLFLLFLLLGGVVTPIGSLARLLPAEPLITVLRSALSGSTSPGSAILSLCVWAAASLAVATTFRWEPSV